MRIDRSQFPWALAAVVLFLFALIRYRASLRSSFAAPSGGSNLGIALGGAGYVLMVIAVLLAIRKRFPTKHIRRIRWMLPVQTWMRAHLWLGSLSYPLILLHSGWHFGNGLTLVLMWIFTGVVGTGLLLALLQHFMPHYMTESVPKETIYGNIGQVRAELEHTADRLLEPFPRCNNPLDGQELVSGKPSGAFSTASPAAASDDPGQELRLTYDRIIKPYLAKRNPRRHQLRSGRIAEDRFAQWRDGTPEQICKVIDQLEEICQAKRDLDRQSRLHFILHSWLLLHVPLSVTLIALGAIHAWKALRYGG